MGKDHWNRKRVYSIRKFSIGVCSIVIATCFLLFGASVAGALGVQFGGRVSYFGKEADKPTIGDKIKDFELEDIKKNIKIMYAASFLSLVMFSVISLGICFLI